MASPSAVHPDGRIEDLLRNAPPPRVARERVAIGLVANHRNGSPVAIDKAQRSREPRQTLAGVGRPIQRVNDHQTTRTPQRQPAFLGEHTEIRPVRPSRTTRSASRSAEYWPSRNPEGPQLLTARNVLPTSSHSD